MHIYRRGASASRITAGGQHLDPEPEVIVRPNPVGSSPSPLRTRMEGDNTGLPGTSGHNWVPNTLRFRVTSSALLKRAISLLDAESYDNEIKPLCSIGAIVISDLSEN